MVQHQNEAISKPGPEVAVDIVLITPSDAEAWLSGVNSHNRRLKDDRVATYRRDMATGDWHFNGDTICFDVNGILLDGQHRLAAIVESGVSVWCILVVGLEPVAQETMDVGARRTAGDSLTLRGEANANVLAAVARFVVRWDLGARLTTGKVSATFQEVSACIAADRKNLDRAVEVAVLARGAHVPMSPANVGAMYLICSRLDADQADQFFVDQFINAVGLEMNSPARVLLRRLAEETGTSKRRMHPDDALRYMVTAWNYFRAGRQVSKLTTPRGGWTGIPEPR